jgi:hypothetical protein
VRKDLRAYALSPVFHRPVNELAPVATALGKVLPPN